MSAGKRRLGVLTVCALLGGLLLTPATARAANVPHYDYASPIFGLSTAPDGSLLVADAGAGIVQLRKGKGSLIVKLPNVTDVAPIGRGSMYAVTSSGEESHPTDGKLFRVSLGRKHALADLFAFEERVNPDGGVV